MATASLVLAFDAVSDGRMTDNVYTLAFAGTSGNLLVESSRHFFEGLRKVFLLPLALVFVVLGVAGRKLTLFHVAFIFALVGLIVISSDAGTWRNQVIDVAVLASVLVADLWSRAGADKSLEFMRAVVVVVVAWGLVGSYQTELRDATRDAALALGGRGSFYPAHPLTGVIGADESVLSEDPYVSVSRGQEPVVLDAFMLRRLLRDHHEWQSALVRKIDQRATSNMDLFEPLDPSNMWFQQYDFGIPVVSALARNYHLSTVREGYWVYAPKRLG